MAIPMATATTCSVCGESLNAKGECLACLIRAALDESVAKSAPPVSLVFGDFEIVRREDGSLWELGRGGMGVTYLAEDKVLRRKVALKVIQVPTAARTSQAVRERFLREARAAAALRHPNIATVFQFGAPPDGRHCYYAMELVEGETLETRVRRDGPLDAKLVLEIATQITRALMAAAAHGLIHRDLKPGNIMLTDPEESELIGRDHSLLAVAGARRERTAQSAVPTVKVIDFGLAKAMADAGGDRDLTHGEFVGTPNFASPEQFESGSVDVRSDIYSLGATLWFALTGKTPFAGRNIEEIHRAQKSNVFPIEQMKAARVPSRLRSLLKSMLAFEPTARPGLQDLAMRLQRCSALTSGAGRARVALAAATMLILGVSGFFAFHSWQTGHRPVATVPPEKSIAVLPFQNLSRDPDNAYFADGVMDEILTDLSRIADLKVISRTSVMHYKSPMAAGRNLREIGRQLGVAHVVEGSVQRSGNQVRVNAQLVDTRTDRHLWAQTYDRDLTDVFAIQSEIAKAIADQLQAKLSPAEKEAIGRPPTNDIAAFDLYTRAKNLLLTPGSITLKADLLQAVDLLNKAVARDPSFFEAYCQLASAHDLLYFNALDHTSARLAQAEAAIQVASHLRPDAGETHLARAQNLYLGYRDYDGALAELEVARKSLPNDSRIFELMGYIRRRQGHWQESTRNFEHAAELDPRNTLTLVAIAYPNYAFLRRFAEAKSALDRLLTIEPSDAVKVMHASADLYWKADTRPLHQMIDSIRARDPAAVPNIAGYWLLCALAERDAAGAKSALALAQEPFKLGDNVFFNRPFVEGVIARMTNDEDKARAAFTTARADQEKVVQAQPSYSQAVCVLGVIDAALGRKEEALREGRRAVQLLPVEKDAIAGMEIVNWFAVTAAWVGDKDLACEQLAIALRHPSPVSYGQLKLLPFWDPLRGDPRFEQIVASLAPK
jgi:serine/threonine protein kinase/tetratricopeptide (TPR) repeat protein